ncbi:hypothetical protein QQS21_007838 [Conoideocrella luteorostrata]|uniref:DUF2423 domain-containing protein n=1 Tax=Conoideocrella luteorostrata TaxID=1105319 RepID=A0AAJ0FWK3_9HYPO|nr:hypothetical protein QQS21_007838 [Conoideocrella luteorostrata]
MAKSTRSSTKKENNRRKYASVFSPAEAARNERLSAKLLKLARQPKPESSDVNMDATAFEKETAEEAGDGDCTDETAMALDSNKPKSRTGKKRVDQRKQKKSGIVFTKYSDRIGTKKKKTFK